MGDDRVHMMTGREVKDIQSNKGWCFSARFISDFCLEWDAAVQRIKKSGAELGAIMITGK